LRNDNDPKHYVTQLMKKIILANVFVGLSGLGTTKYTCGEHVRVGNKLRTLLGLFGQVI